MTLYFLCSHACESRHACVCRSQMPVSGIFLIDHYHGFVFERGFLTEPGTFPFCQIGWPRSPGLPPGILVPSAGIIGVQLCPILFICVLGLQCRSQGYTQTFHHQATFLALLLSFLAASHHRSGLQQPLPFPQLLACPCSLQDQWVSQLTQPPESLILMMIDSEFQTLGWKEKRPPLLVHAMFSFYTL